MEEISKQFTPAHGGSKYRAFQEFFSRKIKTPPPRQGTPICPCERIVCEASTVSEGMMSIVKGDTRFVDVIFSEPPGYHYTNASLYNRNYHRIHSLVDGVIESIRCLPGKQSFSRPRLNGRSLSFPAMFHKRVSPRMRDNEGRPRLFSISGGSRAEAIELASCIEVGVELVGGQEIARYRLRSTCGITSPVRSDVSVGDEVSVGMKYA